MADEEKTETEEQPEEAAAEEQAPEEEAEAAAPEDAGASDEVAEEAEDSGPPHPKTLRKQKRSQASGPAKPERSPAERATERVEDRRRNAAERRRHRAKRQRGGEPGTGTSPAERGAGPKKVRTGTVVSTKAAKTITVKIEVTRRHPTYEKVVRRTATLHAHDEAGQAQEGDVVRVVETRPLSRTKRWRLVEVLERAR